MIEERGVQLDLEIEDEPTKESEVFYNPEMTLNRDVSVAVLQAYQQTRRSEEGMRVLDALAGSGIRGLRYWNEVDNIDQVTVNDSNPSAIKNIRANLALNDAEEIEVTEEDANLLMTRRRKEYDFVDIDPFGSPAPFTDSAVRSLYHAGFAGFTATDLAALCGTYRKTCRRRYASWSLNTSYCHEIGLRVLIKFLFESFARFDKVFRPKLSFSQRHYYRVFGEVKETKKGVNRMLDNVGYLLHCDGCGSREFVEKAQKRNDCRYCDGHVHILGPLWTGKLGRQNFCDPVLEILKDNGYEEAYELVSTVRDEVRIRTPYYDTHRLGKYLGIPASRRDVLIKNISDMGYPAVQTHFAPTGIRTNCPIDQIKELMQELYEEV